MTSKLTREQAVDTIHGLEGIISRGVQSVYLDMALAGMRQLLAAMDSEPVTVPEHITYISEPTILNILANDDSSPMANAARLLAYEVRFWRSFPLYRHAQPAPVVPDDGLIAELLAIAKEAADDADAIAYAEFSDKSMRHTTAISDWERRAAMLNGGKS
ncbi:hypothetical protein [Klebsiella variicola]|uniref:hypothetical protein n=1 Tax=Klebsiella variicola TaxID=244366 RepID=UPI0022E87239|nr:hypothetical protein [Klebsiella variicola]